MKTKLLLLLLMLSIHKLNAQELNARVQIMAPQVSNINKSVLDNLQKVIRDFLNNNKFTNESYQPTERIECNLVLTISSWDGGSNFTAEAQIQSSRPVFNSNYQTTLLNMSDKNFDFQYNEGATIDFSDQNYISNISSLLSFYAFTIIGLDKDSFGIMAGSNSYKNAQNVVNIAQTAGGKGWKAVDGLRNRYWLNENLLNPVFNPLRKFIYNYHIKGMDLLSEGTKGYSQVFSSLTDLQQMDKQKLGSIFPNIYFTAKAEELSNVLSKLQPQDKIKAFNMLIDIDPANISKYEALKKN